EAYQRLVGFLDGQTRDPGDPDYIERVSIPGYLSGDTVCLFSGQVVPVLVPNLRGMFGWNVNALIDSVVSQARAFTADENKEKAEQNVRGSLRNFLDRIYFDLRNLGQTPAERALN